jgi:Asp/Glu/hydantoin racemase
MTCKIAVVMPGGFDLNDGTVREVIGKILVRNVEKLKQDNTVLDFYLMKKGIATTDAMQWECLHVSNNLEFFETIRGLQGKGYDAVVSHCAGDPLLYPLKQMMDIPVVGAFQNALIFASLMGKKIGMVTWSKYIIPVLEELVVKYGFKDSVTSIRSMDTTNSEFFEAFSNAEPLIEKFCECARKCISDGAEVLVPS